LSKETRTEEKNKIDVALITTMRNKENSISPESPKNRKVGNSSNKKKCLMSPKPFRGESNNDSPCLRIMNEPVKELSAKDF
jgi:hypothetical protein